MLKCLLCLIRAIRRGRGGGSKIPRILSTWFVHSQCNKINFYYLNSRVPECSDVKPAISEKPESFETPQGFKCPTCEKVFKRESHLNQHVKVHDNRQWECDVCKKIFTTKYFLKKHKRLHTGNWVLKYFITIHVINSVISAYCLIIRQFCKVIMALYI